MSDGTPTNERHRRTISLDAFKAELKAQGLPREHLTFICPACGTLQSAADLIAAGAGKTFEDVESFLGFSCVGRWTDAGPPKRGTPPGAGCNWTLGGQLQIHDLTVVTPDGGRHPRFEPASPEAAQAHYAERTLKAGSRQHA